MLETAPASAAEASPRLLTTLTKIRIWRASRDGGEIMTDWVSAGGMILSGLIVGFMFWYAMKGRASKPDLERSDLAASATRCWRNFAS